MELIYSPWIYLIIFIASGSFIVYEKQKRKKQLVVATGCLMMIFYSVCFLSGICTILNFIWRWIL